MNTKRSPSQSSGSCQAFTLVELLVICAVLTVLALVMLPVFAGTKSDSKLFQCINNQRHLAKAFILSATDNNDQIVPFANSGGFWTMASGAQNSDTTAQRRALVQSSLQTNNLLYAYAPRVNIYHCPADERDGLATLAAGWAYDSYSKSQNVGGESFNNYWGAGSTYTTLSAISSPAKTFCFSEEADSRNRNVGTWVLQWTTGTPNFIWVDPPALFHGSFSSFAFADGSVGTRQWLNAGIINAGLAAARSQAALFSAPTSGSDYQFVHERYRFPGWQ